MGALKGGTQPINKAQHPKTPVKKRVAPVNKRATKTNKASTVLEEGQTTLGLKREAPTENNEQGDAKRQKFFLIVVEKPRGNTDGEEHEPNLSGEASDSNNNGDDSAVEHPHGVAADQEQIPNQVPEVWAINRQGLCDALPYFKSHQGGLYTRNCIAYGVLIDAAGYTIRDQFGAEVIITTMGGGRKQDKNGNWVRKKNHEPKSWKYWAQTMEQHQPMVVVAGNEHPGFPCSPVHRYSVLDSFWITDIWSEVYKNEKGVATQVCKVRLEKIKLDKKSWWWDETSENAVKVLAPCHTQPHAVPQQTCQVCGKSSKHIFTQGWTCLNYKCKPRFFKFSGGSHEFNDLTYTDDFLLERSAFPEPSSEVPALTPSLPSDNVLESTSKDARLGVVCQQCGCCSRRRYWNRWECENPDCDFQLHVDLKEHKIRNVEAESAKHAKYAATMISKSRKDPGQQGGLLDDVTLTLDKCIIMDKLTLGGYTASIYVLPNKAGEALGCVVVYRASNVICRQKDGPNDLYRDLQHEDLGLHRNPTRCPNAWNEVWTRHFQQNFGAPYKFGVAVASKSFEEAPDPILKSLARLQWAGKTAVQVSDAFLTKLEDEGTMKKAPVDVKKDEEDAIEKAEKVTGDGTWKDFNELLALGYMEKDEISYHDDGEKQLGPTVATLSLGSPSKMSFRPKITSGITSARGLKKKTTKKTTEKEDDADDADGEDSEGIKKKEPTAYHEVLELRLKHGDMVVMHGTAIHRDYVHKVQPLGKRRFALTARKIREDAIPPEDQAIAARMGTLPDSYAGFGYHGDDDALARVARTMEIAATSPYWNTTISEKTT